MKYLLNGWNEFLNGRTLAPDEIGATHGKLEFTARTNPGTAHSVFLTANARFFFGSSGLSLSGVRESILHRCAKDSARLSSESPLHGAPEATGGFVAASLRGRDWRGRAWRGGGYCETWLPIFLTDGRGGPFPPTRPVRISRLREWSEGVTKSPRDSGERSCKERVSLQKARKSDIGLYLFQKLMNRFGFLTAARAPQF